jgi:alpha-N-arabinofuranosidase
LSAAITHVLKVSAPSGATGTIGFANQGYNGVPVDVGDFSSYFWIKGTYSGSIEVSLYDTSDNTVWGSTTVDVTSTADDWIEVSANLTATQSTDASNAWGVSFDASQVAGGELYFGLVRLYPETYHDE